MIIVSTNDDISTLGSEHSKVKMFIAALEKVLYLANIVSHYYHGTDTYICAI